MLCCVLSHQRIRQLPTVHELAKNAPVNIYDSALLNGAMLIDGRLTEGVELFEILKADAIIHS